MQQLLVLYLTVQGFYGEETGEMGPKFYILHDIPGRLRFHIPALRDNMKYDEIQTMFSSLKGIQRFFLQIPYRILVERLVSCNEPVNTKSKI